MPAPQRTDARRTSDVLMMRVEGMDCGACALKIESAVKRLPGASDVDVNYTSGILSLRLDTDRTSRTALESRIRALGYRPASLDEADNTPATAPASRAAWWTTGQAKTVAGTGLLLLTGCAVAIVAPATAPWAFSVAAIVGLIPVARRAIAATRVAMPFTIETLMTIATVGAIAIGAPQEAAVVIFLFAVGELLEGISAARARAGIEALIGLVPRIARLEDGAGMREVPIESLAIGDVVLVRPGDRVPSDAEVVDGRSEVDEAPITGESVPVAKDVGDTVYAGSINASAVLRARVTRTAADNTLARIIHLVAEAQATKAPTARFIDRFAALYTPAAMVAALLIVCVPPLAFGADWWTWIYRGLATLLIACPCALVISTPAAIASGLAAGARRGLLVKGGAALETLAKVQIAAFDKTGTLTVGRPAVTDVVGLAGTDDEILAKAAAVETGSSHPLAVAIVRAAQSRELAVSNAFGATALPGKGVTARLRDGFVSVGSPRYAAELGTLTPDAAARIEAFEADGKTVVVVADGKRALGLVALRDELRPDAAPAVARLRALRIRPVLLTGDNRIATAAVARTLEIETRSELLPDSKLAAIAELQRQGPVVMVGDGINDAPALASADVGVAMGGGTEVALETADAALLNDRVHGVADMVTLARATMANIGQNIALALGLKGVLLVTTLVGLSSLWMAILADTGATVLVTANALRLLRHAEPGRRRADDGHPR